MKIVEKEEERTTIKKLAGLFGFETVQRGDPTNSCVVGMIAQEGNELGLDHQHQHQLQVHLLNHLLHLYLENLWFQIE